MAALTPATERERLLAESLGVAARAQALRAIEAIGLLEEFGTTLLVLHGLQSHDSGQQGNALEMIDSWDKRAVVRPALALWETAVAAPAGSAVAANPATVGDSKNRRRDSSS